VLGLVITVALAAGPVGLGAVYDRFGRYDPGLWFVAFTSVVAVVAVSWGTRTEQRASEG
jgi:cyanate permease